MHVEGSLPIPIEIEYLWQKIQDNKVPSSWIAVSFATSHIQLSDYLIDFIEKLKYWQEVISIVKQSGKLPSFFNISHFFDPNQFLYAQLQLRARVENVTTRKVYNTFSVIDYFEPTYVLEEGNHMMSELKERKHSTVLYGLWLEGAEWDPIDEVLVET